MKLNVELCLGSYSFTECHKTQNNLPRSGLLLCYVRLEVFTAVTMKNGVFSDVTPSVASYSECWS
jgi:hypothetical protein